MLHKSNRCTVANYHESKVGVYTRKRNYIYVGNVIVSSWDKCIDHDTLCMYHPTRRASFEVAKLINSNFAFLKRAPQLKVE